MRLFDLPVGVAYALSMGIAGNVLIGIGDILVDLAGNVNSTSVSSELQCLFLVRGLGQLVATPLAAELFSTFHGHGLIVACLFAITVLWSVSTWIGSAWGLYLWFLATGIITSTLDTGTQILTRRVYGSKAGPWLTANTLVFASAGLVSPLITYVTNTTAQESYVYASFALAVAAVVLVTCDNIYFWPRLLQEPPPTAVEGGEKRVSPPPRGAEATHHHHALGSFFSSAFSLEWHMAFIVFLAIGGQNVYSSYVITFLQATGAVSARLDSAVLSVFWAATVISRLIAITQQLHTTTRRLLRGMMLLALTALLATVPLYIVVYGYPGKEALVWASTALYGAAIGPILGYLFDAQNRLSTASERGSAVLIFGMNLGTSFVPWLFVLLWDLGAASLAFPIALGLAPAISIVLILRLHTWAEQHRSATMDMTNIDVAIEKKACKSPEDERGDEEENLIKEQDVTTPLTQGSRHRRFVAQVVVASYLVLVTGFYFLASSYPALYAVQFSDGDDCNTPGYYCASPYNGEEASVLAFYAFLWGLGIWGLCRIHNQAWRRRTERMLYVPLLKWRTTPREVVLLASVAALAVFWFCYYWSLLGSRASGVERFNLTVGHMNDLFISLLILLTARASVWDYLLGVSYEQSIGYHAWMGTLAFSSITVHLAIWWILWIKEGEWVEEAWTRTSDPNVNLMTGEACSFWQSVAATCGNGHFWAIPAMEAWYWLLGLPALGFLAYYPIRRAHYQAFYYGHHQFLVFFPIAYYHSWNLWKFATVGLALWFVSRAIISRMRATRELVVKNIQHHPGGVTFIELRRADGKALTLQTPGQFVWLNVPYIDALEWHPFSISSAPSDGPSWTHHIKAVSPPPGAVRRAAESTRRGPGDGLYAARYREWTQRLYTIAEDPSTARQLKVYYDGPYGVDVFRPESGDVDEVVFIAGGIGITNPLSYFLQAVNEGPPPALGMRGTTRMHLIWVVRHREMFSAFASQLLVILSADRDDIHVTLYETGSPPPTGETTPLLHGSDPAPEHTAFMSQLKVHAGRPDLYKALDEASSFWRGPKPESRVAVFVCGPEPLVQAAEDAAVELNKNKDISVFFHAEAFAL